jgi:hypothetical protein
VVLQADVVRPRLDFVLVQVEGAGSQLKNRADRVHHRVHLRHVGVRAEVFGPVLLDGPGLEDAGEALIFDADVGVGLVVAEVDVVAGLELLDLIVFEDERLHLRVRHNDVDVHGLLDHHVDASVPLTALLKIGPHPGAQVFGLAHVQDGVVLVEKFVHARVGG